MTKLSTQEERIMLVLWKLGNCTVAQIIELYNDPKPSQNTIATFMGILEKKNLVRHRRIGRSYEYSAIVSKFDYSQFLLGQIFKKKVKEIHRLVINADTLFATSDHKFYTNGNWVKTALLSVGMIVQTNSGSATILDNQIKTDTVLDVYNFTVENAHTYFVGNGQVLTHNDCNFIDDLIEGLETVELKKAFVNSLRENADLVAAYKNGTVSIDSWKLMREAINTSTNAFAKDLPSLKKLTKMMETNSSFRNATGANWREDLIDILSTSATSPCSVCGNSGIIGRLSMDDYLASVDYFVQNIDINTKGEGFYNWMRGRTLGQGEPLETQLDELHHTLEVIRREGITNGELIDLGKQFPNGTKKYDILLSNGEYLELKNKIYTSTGISSADADQLIDGYFRNINSIDDFTWELKWAKNKSVWSSTSQAEIAMKEKWKVIFLARKQEIFDVMNVSLKESLEIQSIMDLTDTKIDGILSIIIKVR